MFNLIQVHLHLIYKLLQVYNNEISQCPLAWYLSLHRKSSETFLKSYFLSQNPRIKTGMALKTRKNRFKCTFKFPLFEELLEEFLQSILPSLIQFNLLLQEAHPLIPIVYFSALNYCHVILFNQFWFNNTRVKSKEKL